MIATSRAAFLTFEKEAAHKKRKMAISVDFSFSSPDLDERLSWLNAPAAATPTPAGLRVVPHVGDWWSRTADSSSDDLDKRRVDEAAPLLLVSPASAAAAAAARDERGGGDFDLEASLAMFHRRDYDQAGVCVRASASCWLKANVERMPDGRLVLACCVTNGGITDLSCCPLDERCLGGGGGGGGGGVPTSPPPPPSSSSLSSQAVSISSPPSGSVSVSAAGGVPGASAAIRLRVRRRRGDYSVEWAPPPTPLAAKAGGDGQREEPPASFTRFRLCRLHEDDGGVEVVSSLRVGVYASAPVAAGFVALFRSLKVGPPESGPLF